MSETGLDRSVRILVVEDEPLVAMSMEDSLDVLGISMVGPAGTVAKALTLIEEGGFDGALVDVNLHGQRVDAVADALAKAEIPFVFTTGYGADGLPEEHRHRPTLIKPFRSDDIAAALARYIVPGWIGS